MVLWTESDQANKISGQQKAASAIQQKAGHTKEGFFYVWEAQKQGNKHNDTAVGTVDMKNIFFYETRIGKIGIISNREAVTGLFFAGGTGNAVEGTCNKETAVIREAAKQLTEYLDGKRRRFDIPMAFEGTPFQRKVWEALTRIPYGETRSYAEIAGSIGQPKACRAVGMANNRNPIAVMVPCHRVIGANGKLVGYAGGLDVKQKLLELEKNSEQEMKE